MADDNPKTFADLGQASKPDKVIVGRSMVDDGRKPVDVRLQELREKRQLENELLEAGGYDYNGDDGWSDVMRKLGRR